MEISYSDGQAIEEQILKILMESKEISSDSAPGFDHYHYSWPIRYHLSPERSNLIRHLSFNDLNVLEIGAGMGAMSRYMAEHCKHLHIVEGTQARYDCLSQRLRDLSNWTGEITNIQHAKPQGPFDIACLYGVFEYSELYITPGGDLNPFQTHLKFVQELLSTEGVLILAIENAVGLKYFAGAPEDHTGKLFDGICGYQKQASPRTFSKMQLTKLLIDSGFESIDYFYPFPDYKLVRTVISDELMCKSPQFCADLSSLSTLQQSLIPRPYYFPESLAAHTLSDAGMLADMSNSFLVIASRQGDSTVRQKLLSRTQRDLAWHYSQNWKENHFTKFYFCEEGQLTSSKTMCDETSRVTEYGGLKFHFIKKSIPDRPVAESKQFRHQLLQHSYFSNYDILIEDLLRFFHFLQQTFCKNDYIQDLSGEALDATFFNAVLKDDSFVLYDLEWEVREGITLSWLVLRNVLALNSYCSMTLNSYFKTPGELYHLFCDKLEIVPDLEMDILRESAFQGAVSLVSSEDYVQTCKLIVHTPYPEKRFPRHPAEEKAITEFAPESLTPTVKMAMFFDQWLTKHGKVKSVLRKSYYALNRLCSRNTQ